MMNLAKTLALGLVLAVSAAVNAAGALAVTLTTTSALPVAVPAECGDAGTTSQYVSQTAFPLRTSVDQAFVSPQTGTAGVLIIQPGSGVDTQVLHTQLPLPQGSYQQTFITSINSGSPNYIVYLAYSFIDSGNVTRFGVSRLPANQVNGSFQISNHLLKGKGGLVNITVNTDLASLNNSSALVNLAFPTFQPNNSSTNFKLLGIEALITNTNPATPATITFNDFKLNGVVIGKDTVDNLSCDTFLTLIP